MKIKPLPCPFCGKQPGTDPVDPHRQGDAWGEVYCFNARCPTYDGAFGRGVRVKDGTLVADDRGSDKYIEAAIRRWNRRH